MNLHILKRHLMGRLRLLVGEARFGALGVAYRKILSKWTARHENRFGPGSGPFDITLYFPGGFGAILRNVLMLHYYFETYGIDAALYVHSRFYGGNAKTDMMQLYFDRVDPHKRDLTSHKSRRKRVSLIDAWAISTLRRFYDQPLSLADARILFSKYYRLKPGSAALIDRRFNELGITGSCLLGLHYRGTDKHTEAPRTSYKDFLDDTQAILSAHPEIDGVLILTDEAGFIEEARLVIQSVPVYGANPPIPAIAGTPLHLDARDPLVKGQEALEAILMLARCRYMLKTPSFLSSWAGLVSPDLIVFMPIRPNPESFVFPEREVFEAARPVPRQGPLHSRI